MVVKVYKSMLKICDQVGKDVYKRQVQQALLVLLMAAGVDGVFGSIVK